MDIYSALIYYLMICPVEVSKKEKSGGLSMAYPRYFLLNSRYDEEDYVANLFFCCMMSEKHVYAATGQEYTISPREYDILQKVSPKIQGTVYQIPVSQYCSSYNHQRRMVQRNEMALYKRTSDLSGESLISCYHPDSPHVIYGHKERRSDKWNPLDYGIVYDFSQPFFVQFGSFWPKVPKMAVNVTDSLENCDYCNYGVFSKGCYMCVAPSFSENCYYSQTPYKCYYDIDGYLNIDNQYCYGCFYATNCYACQHAIYAWDCKHSQYLMDCVNCEYCFGCVNLQHKKYCFFNEQLDRQTYLEKVNRIIGNSESMAEYKDRFDIFILEHPKRATRNDKCEDTTGDLNIGTKNCTNCFGMVDIKDSHNVRIGGIQSNDLYDCYSVGLGSRMYSCIGAGESDTIAWCIKVYSLFDCYYCAYCYSCDHCFGCVGLRNKKYCIFNTQYTKNEYEELLAKIIPHMQSTGEWGEFFPADLSPFPYNDTVAQEFFPLTQDTAHDRWRDVKKQPDYTGEVYIPKEIAEYKNNAEEKQKLLSGVLVCIVTGKPYRILQQELDFYIKHTICIPRKHPEQRYNERFRYRLPNQLRERTCMKTGVPIITPYAPDRSEIVWAESVRDKEFRG